MKSRRCRSHPYLPISFCLGVPTSSNMPEFVERLHCLPSLNHYGFAIRNNKHIGSTRSWSLRHNNPQQSTAKVQVNRIWFPESRADQQPRLHQAIHASSEGTMKLIVAGASGFVASETIKQALHNPDVTTLVTLSRRPVPAPKDLPPGTPTSKLQNIVIEDYENYSPEVLNHLEGADACIWYASSISHNK